VVKKFLLGLGIIILLALGSIFLFREKVLIFAIAKDNVSLFRASSRIGVNSHSNIQEFELLPYIMLHAKDPTLYINILQERESLDSGRIVKAALLFGRFDVLLTLAKNGLKIFDRSKVSDIFISIGQDHIRMKNEINLILDEALKNEEKFCSEAVFPLSVRENIKKKIPEVFQHLSEICASDFNVE
jgi:hypothetical protein